jgi:hypothetical protein
MDGSPFKIIFDEVIEKYPAIADDKHFCELAVRLADKLAEKREQEAADKRQDLPRDYSHLYGFKVGVAYSTVDENTVYKDIAGYFSLPEAREAFEARVLKFKELLKKCRNNTDAIVSFIKKKGLYGAVSCFIADRLDCAEEARFSIAFRLGEELLKDGKVAVAHMAYAYPLEDKYRHKSQLKKNELPYICYGVSPSVSGSDIPSSFKAVIDEADDIIDSATADELPITSNNEVKAEDFALFVKSKREVDSGFPILLPEWLKKKASVNKTPDFGWLSLPELDYVRLVDYLARERFNEINLIKVKDLDSPQEAANVFKEQLRLAFIHKKDSNTFVFSFQNHKGDTEEVEITLNLLKSIITLLKGSQKCLAKTHK